MPSQLIKCVIWDLDDTVWTGTLTEDLRVEVKQEVLECIYELDQVGVLNSVASRNDADYASSTVQDHGLNEIFLSPRYSFDAKSTLVGDIAAALNIRAEYICFVDDQLFEREEVLSAHPMIRCFDPQEFLEYWNTVRKEYDRTEVAQHRRRLYSEDFARKSAEAEFKAPYESFLQSLNLRMEIRHSAPEEWSRIHELLVRTNQFNSMGSGADTDLVWSGLHRSEGYVALSAHVEDRFGSYGDVGFCLIRVEPNTLTVVRLAFSCRVLSRGVGQSFLSYLIRCAADLDKQLLVEVVNSEKNRQLEIALRMAGFEDAGVSRVVTLKGPETFAHYASHVFVDDSQVVFDKWNCYAVT